MSRDESLRAWTYGEEKYIIPKGMSQETLSRLRMVAECFRDATFIYLHSTIERIIRGRGEEEGGQIIQHLTVSKAEALGRFRGRIRSCLLFDDAAHCEYSALTFPLFIAGCESREPEVRDDILSRLDALEVNFGIGNVKRAKELLDMVWSSHSQLHWMDVLESLDWQLILA